MKKLISLILCFVFVLSLTACGRTMDKVVSDTESMGNSVVSGTESVVDSAKNAVKNEEDKMNLMAGITSNDAVDAALNHAGLTKSQVSNIDVDLDRDNGKLIYEVDFNSGNVEYDYDVNAETGEVISADKSRD